MAQVGRRGALHSFHRCVQFMGLGQHLTTGVAVDPQEAQAWTSSEEGKEFVGGSRLVPAVSQHLRVLRESGFAISRVDGARRLYSIKPMPFQEVDSWLDRFRGFWQHKLDALATEIARGKRKRQR
jgi:hypothetical protein